MRRMIVLPALDLVERFQAALADYVGGYLAFSVIRPVLNHLLDIYCYGTPRDSARTSIQSELIAWGVPREEALRAEAVLIEELYDLIQRAFRVVYPSRTYHYQWMNGTELVIVEEQKPLEALVELTMELSENEDRGYIPPRLRRR